MLSSPSLGADDSGLNRMLAARAQAGIPINVMYSGNLNVVGELAIRNPNTQLMVDLWV